jgi:hypothetical protein
MNHTNQINQQRVTGFGKEERKKKMEFDILAII